MENFNAIPIFIAVVENGSFSAAAAKLALSKSAVSKRITQLENQLATRLLHRSTRALSLTQAGERYYEHALNALQAARKASDSVTQLQSEPTGTLRICAPMSFGQLHLATLIPVFLQRFPKLEIDLVLNDPILNLIEHRFDIAIGSGDLPSDGIVVRRLTQAHSVICASPYYLEQHSNILQPKDLHAHNCLYNSASSNAKIWQFKQAGQLQEINIQGNYSVNNSEALARAATQGLGVARLPSFVAAALVAQQKLQIVLANYQMPAKPIYLSYAARQHLPHKVRLFLDFCIEHFASDTDLWRQNPESL